MITVTVTTTQLQDANACNSALELFKNAFGDSHTMEWTLENQVELVTGPLRDHIRWAYARNILPRINLRGAELRSADLHRADLSDANLSYADLRYANLRGANLRAADLQRAQLGYANLRCAELGAAILYGANLSDAELYGADLRYANLRYADLHGARCNNATQWPDDFDYRSRGVINIDETGETT